MIGWRQERLEVRPMNSPPIKNPPVQTVGEGKNGYTNKATPRKRPRQGKFVPPRFKTQFPALRNPHDIKLATSIRGAIRRSINRGLPGDAAYWSGLAASFVQRRAVNVGGE